MLSGSSGSSMSDATSSEATGRVPLNMTPISPSRYACLALWRRSSPLDVSGMLPLATRAIARGLDPVMLEDGGAD